MGCIVDGCGRRCCVLVGTPWSRVRVRLSVCFGAAAKWRNRKREREKESSLVSQPPSFSADFSEQFKVGDLLSTTVRFILRI